MKRRMLAPLLVTALLLTGCSTGTTTPGAGSGPAATPTEEQAPPAAPLDLTGEWKQTNSNAPDSYQAASITGDTITINWVNEAESTTALYWVGTYVAPTEDTDTYTWTSTGDVAQMQNALMASSEDAKEFTYTGGKLTYELSALGMTMTVEMEKQ